MKEKHGRWLKHPYILMLEKITCFLKTANTVLLKLIRLILYKNLPQKQLGKMKSSHLLAALRSVLFNFILICKYCYDNANLRLLLQMPLNDSRVYLHAIY